MTQEQDYICKLIEKLSQSFDDRCQEDGYAVMYAISEAKDIPGYPSWLDRVTVDEHGCIEVSQ